MKTIARSTLIALTGGSGAGKTWLANRLCQHFGDEGTSLALDDFYRDLSHLDLARREAVNFDHPDTIDWPLFESVMRTLQSGATVLAPRYDFASHTRSTSWETRNPRPFIFVEGLWLLWHPRVRHLFHLRVFLDCVQSLRWQQRAARDLGERGRNLNSIREQFWKVVAPMHERFVEVQKAWADLVIDQSMTQSKIGRLVATIRAVRTEPRPTPSRIDRLRTTAPPVAALHSP